MEQLRDAVQTLAASNTRVLIVGPTGSGKEVVARAIHDLSRRPGAFVAVNCAALPEDLVESELFGHERGAFTGAVSCRRGMFELADRGTILLDEVEDLARAAQAKLLRVLETLRIRRVGSETEIALDVRILAASNRDLVSLVASGAFRADLYHRLNVVPITVPPLADHRQDIPELVRHFLGELGAGEVSLRAEALRQLTAHQWPGNVRELRNAIERALVFAQDGCIGRFDFSPSQGCPSTARPSSLVAAIADLTAAFADAVRSGTAPSDLLVTIERTLAETALTLAAGNQTAAARWLNIDRKRLHRRLHRRQARGDPWLRAAGGAD